MHHLSVRTIVATAPATDLDGTVHVERHVEGDTQRFVVDTSRLVAAVSDVPVPPVRAAARLRASLLTVDDLSSPDIGLAARGSIDLERGASEFHAEANVAAPEISRYPWVAGRASGALRLHAEVNGRNGRLTAEVHGATQRLRVGGTARRLRGARRDGEPRARSGRGRCDPGREAPRGARHARSGRCVRARGG